MSDIEDLFPNIISLLNSIDGKLSHITKSNEVVEPHPTPPPTKPNVDAVTDPKADLEPIDVPSKDPDEPIRSGIFESSKGPKTFMKDVFSFTINPENEMFRYYFTPTDELVVSLEDGPVTLEKVSPEPRSIDGRLVNGMQINPMRSHKQGFDSAAHSKYAPFDASLRQTGDLVIDKPTSVILSYTEKLPPGHRPFIESAIIVTFVNNLPARPSYLRPAYMGELSKVFSVDIDEIVNEDTFPKMPIPKGFPGSNAIINRFRLPWLDHGPTWKGRYFHPVNNMPDYGREIAITIGQAAVALCLDIPLNKKRRIAASLLTYALDLKKIFDLSGGPKWILANGGHAPGRKFPMLLLASLAGDPIARQYVESPYWGEDAQTFYVDDKMVKINCKGDKRDRKVVQYKEDDIGMAEWGIQQWDSPERSNAFWDTYYRCCCTVHAWIGYLAAAKAMSIDDQWGKQSAFDYAVRYMEVEQGVQELRPDRHQYYLNASGQWVVNFFMDVFKDTPSLHAKRNLKQNRIF